MVNAEKTNQTCVKWKTLKEWPNKLKNNGTQPGEMDFFGRDLHPRGF